jgi:hypothetical protein
MSEYPQTGKTPKPPGRPPKRYRREEPPGPRCPRCGLLEPHVCLSGTGTGWARIANPDSAGFRRS